MKAFPWRGLHRSSLHARVMATIALVCLLLVGLDGWRAWQERSLAIAEDKVETANLARSLAQHAHDMIQSADAVLVGLRERVEADGLSPGRLEQLHQAMATRVAGLPVIHGLFVLDAAGVRIVSSLSPRAGSASYADRAYFQYHRLHADRELHIGDPIHSRSDHDWIITVSRRVDSPDGTFRGVVLVTIAIDTLQRFYQTFDVGRQGLIALNTTDGILVARQPLDGITVGSSVVAGHVHQALKDSPVGSFRNVSALDGVLRLGSYRKVEDYGLVVIVGHDFAEVLADWRAEARAHLLVSIGAALALALLGSRFARQIRQTQKVDRRYRLLAENSSDAIVCVGLNGKRIYVSPAFCKLTGWSLEDSLHAEWASLVHPDDRQDALDLRTRLLAGAEQLTSCFRYICKDGSDLWVEARIQLVPAHGDEDACLVANLRDITERRSAENRVAALNRELITQANTDALTGLANRRRFDEALDQEWRRAAREENPLSLLLIDVDRFKLYNDRYGHQKGDHCLRSVASAVAEFARRPGDIAARYGGEEIAVVLPCTPAAGGVELAWRVRAAVEAVRIEHAGNLPAGVVTVSVGVATLWPSAEDAGSESLVAAADAALYEAKRGGRNRVMSSAMTHETTPADIALAPALPEEAGRQWWPSLNRTGSAR